MVPMREISILDTTLRDGLQHEEHYMSLEKRMQLLNGLVEAGVKKIEAGSFAHPGYLPQFREIDKFAMSLPRDNGVAASRRSPRSSCTCSSRRRRPAPWGPPSYASPAWRCP